MDLALQMDGEKKQRLQLESEKCICASVIFALQLMLFGSQWVCVLPENCINPVMERGLEWKKKLKLLSSIRQVLDQFTYFAYLLSRIRFTRQKWRMAQINAISNRSE